MRVYFKAKPYNMFECCIVECVQIVMLVGMSVCMFKGNTGAVRLSICDLRE